MEKTEGERPLVTVITISYNAEAIIERTILSVINQTYPAVEYIIIDGGSTDSTVDIIEKYANKVTYWISEPDNGIYDAMNKGLDIATGKWVSFMNSGDYYYSNNVLDAIFSNGKNYFAQIIYGAVEKRYAFRTVIEKPYPLPDITHKMIFSHQSTFVDLDLMKLYKFDLSYRIIADYAFFFKMYKEKIDFVEVPDIISSYDCSGISSSATLSSFLKQKRELNRLHGVNARLLNYYYSGLFYLLRSQIKKIIPKYLLNNIQYYRWKKKYN